MALMLEDLMHCKSGTLAFNMCIYDYIYVKGMWSV